MIKEFIDKYYLNPIKQDSGYNIVNTPTYAVIFVIAILLIYEYFFRKNKVKINREFAKSLLGWIIFGGSLRIIRDLNIITSDYLVTPYIYILVFIISFLTLLAALRLKKTRKIKLLHSWGLAGYALSAITIAAVITTPKTLNISDFLFIYAIWLLWFILLLQVKKHIPRAKKFLTNWNMAAIMAHLLDATGTFVALTYVYANATFENEKHVLGRTVMEYLETNNILLISGSGSWIMFALKLAVIPLALWAIDKYSENETENKFLKMIIIILGLGIGIRNSLGVLIYN